ncbi:hypothetical protein, partial [Staphylococcus epidermidis]|uniref:hypothetical protein n=1 Tax=Staphylococcus epidermidis TaxID=1282 RepID=UPI0016428869
HLSHPKFLNRKIQQLKVPLAKPSLLTQNTNYINQHLSQKQPYQQPIPKPHQIINSQNNPTITTTHINPTIQQINHPQQNLHAHNKLTQAQQIANNQIQNL